MADKLVMAFRWMTGRCVSCGFWLDSRTAFRHRYCYICTETIERIAEPFDPADYIEVQRPGPEEQGSE